MMNKVISILSSIIFVGIINGDSFRLHLLFTNNIHGAIHEVPARFINPEFSPILAGGAGAYTYVNKLRDEAKAGGDAVFLTDAGNLFQGTQLGTQDGGSKMIQWMNWMSYDAFVPGVRDFDQGVLNLSRLSEKAEFPFLAANLKGVNGIKDNKIIDVNGIRIGVIGLITPFINEGLLPENYEGVVVEDLLETLNEQIAIIRKDVDMIFVLSHLGLPYNREDEYKKFINKINKGISVPIRNALELAHYTDDVDVIITGGFNKGYNTPWVDPNSHTIVVQNYGNLTGIGHLILNIDKRQKIIKDYSLPTKRGMMVNLFTDDIWPNPAISDTIQNWVSSIHPSLKSDYSTQISQIDNKDCSFNVVSKNNDYPVPSVGGDNTLDIITWNMERFPLKGDSTMKAVAEIILDLDVDIIGVQEVIKIGDFAKMMSWIPEYDFVLSRQSSFLEQAIIFKKGLLTVLGQDEPFAFDDYFFAGRPPLVVDFLYSCGDIKQEICVVNMHLKCCGDGLYRRQQSMKQLHGFLMSKVDQGKDKIIAIGDWNDELQDSGIYQSFSPFLNDRENFLFVTEEIVSDSAQQSYPTWPSFLDHIMIGSGFIDIFEEKGIVRSVNIDDWIGGWSIYENLISDHRPILLSLPIN